MRPPNFKSFESIRNLKLLVIFRDVYKRISLNKEEKKRVFTKFPVNLKFKGFQKSD